MRLFFLVIAISTIISCQSREPEKTGLEGNAMPSFKIMLLDSSTLDTKEIPQGKPIVLLYYGPHCYYSREQILEITNKINNLKEINFYFITAWPFDDMKVFDSNYHLNRFKNITTARDYTFFFGSYFKAKGVPYLAIYGKDKKLQYTFIGKIPSDQIKKLAQQ